MAYISLQHVGKRYQMGEITITAVDDISFEIEKGQFAVIVGPSGAGKTTVLNILGGMDACDSGAIRVDGATTYEIRRRIPYVLDLVGLTNKGGRLPTQLSGGEQQRVAIARALAKNPKLLLCDEPTGALDYVTGKSILKLLQDTCRQQGMTVVVITHNSAIAPMADQVIHVKNGRVERIDHNDRPVPVETIEW